MLFVVQMNGKSTQVRFLVEMLSCKFTLILWKMLFIKSCSIFFFMLLMVLNIDILLSISSVRYTSIKTTLRVERYLPNWHRTMSTVKHHDGWWHRGAGLGACPKRECVCRKARKTNNAFHGATKAAILNSSLRASQLCIFCMSLFNTPAC